MKLTTIRGQAVLVCSALAAFGCGDAGGGPRDAEYHGDTLVYTTHRPAEAQLAREVLRVSGSDADIELGEVAALATLPNGGVVVFDGRNARGLALLEFSPDGKFLRVLGRQGHGPGEYATAFVELTVADDGTVFLHDVAQNRVNRYQDGTPLPVIRLPASLGSGLAGETFMAMPDHSLLLNGSLAAQQALNAPLFMRIDSTGNAVDSIIAREPWLAEHAAKAYGSGEEAVPLPGGGWVQIRTDRIGFLRRDASGEVMFISEIPGTAPSYHPEERTELRRVEAWIAAGRRPAQAAREVPTRKQLTRGGFADNDARIWVRRTADALRIPPEIKYWDRRGATRVSWGEPVHLVAFDTAGKFLGAWLFPVRSRLSIRGTTAWAIEPDRLDVPSLVKYSLQQ